ncbi:MAG: chromosomal replication initiator protein DnaA [Bifidobacteriaceae bacterium]|nr:chromosomal replication initiator protein DnaA [Bifidobacteriaceae bacterium]
MVDENFGAVEDDGAVELWNAIKEHLIANSGFSPHQTGYLHASVPILLQNDTLLLSVPHEGVKRFLENNNAVLVDAAKILIGKPAFFSVTINPSANNAFLQEDPFETPSEDIKRLSSEDSSSFDPLYNQSGELHRGDGLSSGDAFDFMSVHQQKTLSKEDIQNALLQSRLNPRYTFDSFVIGKQNRIAAASASALAESFTSDYSPLFIYGASGLGKTHLLHATGIYALDINPDIRCLYINAEEFLNRFTTAVRMKDFTFFNVTLRKLDLLLVDDIQFLSGAEETMEQFFHIFNSLLSAQKRIVITSDVAPKKLKGVEERLITRFQQGLTIDIQPPPFETRVAILQKNVDKQSASVPQNVLFYIAEHVTENIRELEGALNLIVASAGFEGEEITLEYAERMLESQFAEQDKDITVDKIVATVAHFFSIPEQEIYGKSRSAPVVLARQVSMYLARTLTPLSLPKLGGLFGGKDHSTVLNAQKKIEEKIKFDKEVNRSVKTLTKQIKAAKN